MSGYRSGSYSLKEAFSFMAWILDPVKIKKLKKGKSYLSHIDGKKMKSLVREGKFIPGSDFRCLKEIDCVIICVPTPLTSYNTPDLSFLRATAKEISRHLHKELMFKK